MDDEQFKNYLADRYSDQIKWYSQTAGRRKLAYLVFQWAVIVLSATLPVLIATVSEKYQAITIVVSILLAIGTAGLKTFKFQEDWISYRTISETLKKEKHFYDAALGDYAEAADKRGLFVERVEALISRENTLWISTQMNQGDEEKPEKLVSQERE